MLNVALVTYLLVCLLLLHLPPRQPLAASSQGGAPPAPSKLCDAVVSHGYQCQEFQVTTDDGYILGVHRIPEGRQGRGGGGPERPPVLLQHGVLVDGMTWVMNADPEQCLPMILADNGYDVWISNLRGTQFSNRHVTLQPTDQAFWNWTWDELASHDLPPLIDTVINQTAQKPHYVGHSMGTLMALVSLSSSEGSFRFVDKVKSVGLLCPIAYLGNMTSLLAIVAARAFLGELIGSTFGLAEFNPRGEVETVFLRAICANSGLINCYDLLTVFTGSNCCLNESTLDVLVQNEPQPTATKNLVHFAQMFRSGVISKFDYGSSSANMQHYGNSRPPVYDLTRIPRDFPMFLGYGGKDALSNPRDVAKLLDTLKLQERENVQVLYIQEYAHVDFIMGVNAKDLLYNQLLQFFHQL